MSASSSVCKYADENGIESGEDYYSSDRHEVRQSCLLGFPITGLIRILNI